MDSEKIAFEMATTAVETVSKETVNKLTDVIGGFFPFFGLRRKGVSVYIEEIEKSNLPPELKMITIANTRKTFKELNNQAAIAKIAQDVAKEGTDFSKNSDVDDEWISRFMDSAKFVSDEKIQLLWGSVLAKEFEEPNSTPPQVVRILSEITSQYANIFSYVCNLRTTIIAETSDGKSYPNNALFVSSNKMEYLEPLGINFSTLSELDTLGLIQFDAIAGFVETFDIKENSKLHLI